MKKLHFIIVHFPVLLALFTVSAFGNRVALDTTYNGTGYSLQAAVAPPNWSFGSSFVIQPDGKVVIGGHIVINQSSGKFAVMRLNADGTLDASFGSGGSNTITAGDGPIGGKVVLQPDGKILLIGWTYGENESANMAILRFTSNGLLDTTFNQTGYRLQNISGTSFDYSSDVTVLPDGKILVLGATGATLSSPKDTVLMRLNADGSLDTTFNGTGIFTSADAIDEAAGAMIVYPNGKILLGGYRVNPSNNRAEFMLTRIDSNGAVDTTFGSGGKTTTAVTTAGNGNSINWFAQQSDGKILAVGSGYVVRYSANGILDTSFGNNGAAFVSNELGRVKVVEGDKILFLARSGAATFVGRLMPDGAYDTNFNGGGAYIGIYNQSCTGNQIEILNDGKMFMVGSCSGTSGSRIAAFRLKETRTKRHLDFNGDGRTDLSIFRPSSGQWWYLDSLTLANQYVAGTFGAATDKLVPADYTGDGRTDVAVFRPSNGFWYILRSDNNTVYGFPFGADGDVPVSYDYDGDYKADAGVYRPSSGVWYIQKSSGGVTIETFGAAEDKPVPSDYDGDFKTDIAIYRPSTGQWWIKKSTDGSIYAFEFGTAGDRPVHGDYTGDGKTDAAFFRPSTREWFVLRSEDSSYYGFPFGADGDLPTPGNFSGDERYDVAVFRPSTNKWYVQLPEGIFLERNFGSTGDQLIPTTFVP